MYTAFYRLSSERPVDYTGLGMVLEGICRDVIAELL
jgi:hypothetical protein